MTQAEFEAWRARICATPPTDAVDLLVAIFDTLYLEGPDTEWSPDTVLDVSRVLQRRLHLASAPAVRVQTEQAISYFKEPPK